MVRLRQEMLYPLQPHLVIEEMACRGDGVAFARLTPRAERIGLHTGEAVVGNLGSAEYMHYTAIGDTVNVAARLQGLAPAGGIVCSSATLTAAGEGATRNWLKRWDGLQARRKRQLPALAPLPVNADGRVTAGAGRRDAQKHRAAPDSSPARPQPCRRPEAPRRDRAPTARRAPGRRQH